MKHKKKILLVVFVWLGLTSHAQTIQNVDFEQKGNKIDITWQMLGLEVGDKLDVDIFYRIDENSYKRIPADNLDGDHGRLDIVNVPSHEPVIDFEATWDVLADMNMLQGELDFKVEVVVRKPLNTFTDIRDGKKYKQVKIGRQTWMAENLAYKPKKGKYWAFDNDTSNIAKYGYLYDWKTANEVCPNGWHLPTDSEWEELARFIHEDKETGGKDRFGNWILVGGYLKSGRRWTGLGGGTDNYDFSALPGGYYSGEKFNDYEGVEGYWWSVSETSYNKHFASCRYVHFNISKFCTSSRLKKSGLSVRCVRD